MISIVSFILVAIISPVILSIIGNITTNPFESLLIKVFGGISLTPSRRLRGLWIIKYSYKSGEELKVDYLLMKVKQLGKNIVAKTENNEYGKYYFNGNIHMNSYITGIWSSYLDGDVHNGAFQTITTHYGNQAVGKWLGFNRDNIVLDGPMIWTRINETNNRKNNKELIKQINMLGIKKYIEIKKLKDIV